jgi:hypothetical protein
VQGHTARRNIPAQLSVCADFLLHSFLVPSTLSNSSCYDILHLLTRSFKPGSRL